MMSPDDEAGGLFRRPLSHSATIKKNQSRVVGMAPMTLVASRR
jgi:hypothetical protein